MDTETLLRQADEAENRGDFEAQIVALRRLLSIAQQSEQGFQEIGLLTLLGNAYHTQGQFQRAHRFRMAAYQLASRADSGCPPDLLMSIEGDLGRSFIETQDWSKGEEYTEGALSKARALHTHEAQWIYQNNLALIYVSTNRLDEAQRLIEATLAEAEKETQDHYLLGLLHLTLASVFFQTRHLNESQRHARLALTHAKLCQNQPMVTRAQLVLGQSYRVGGAWANRPEYWDEAERYLRDTVAAAQAQGTLLDELFAEAELAELYDHRSQPDEVARHYTRTFDLLERARQTLGYEQFHLNFFQRFQRTYDAATAFHLRQGALNTAFLTSEQARSRLLLALLGQPRTSPLAWPDDAQRSLAAILAQYGAASLAASADGRGQRRGLGGAWTAPTPPATGPSQAPSQQEARRQFLRLYEAQQLQTGGRVPRAGVSLVEPNDVRRLLGASEALVAYVVMQATTVIFTVTREAAHFQHLAYGQAQLEADVAAVGEAIDRLADLLQDRRVAEEWRVQRGPSEWPEEIQRVMRRLWAALDKLYALLIAPILPAVSDKAHWIMVPHGPLHRLPWAALRDGERYLVERHTLSALPSASLGAALAARPPQAGGTPLFLANPDLGAEQWRLPASESEVARCAALLPTRSTVHSDAQATKAAFLAHAPSASLIHLACHHFFDPDVPLLSTIPLSGVVGPDWLYAFEVVELRLAAQLVALSACSSGRSGVATGDEQLGMVRAFLAAGAQSVLSTLWVIGDAWAPDFLTEFYRHALTEGLAEALAAVQRRWIGDPQYTLPYFWAPFVLSGQWGRPLSLDAGSAG